MDMLYNQLIVGMKELICKELVALAAGGKCVHIYFYGGLFNETFM